MKLIQKILLKRTQKTSTTTSTDYYTTNTLHPKGKVGELVSLWTFRRDFKDGNRHWVFRKFGELKKMGVFANGESFGKALEKRGFEKLGSGYYSTVYAKPKSKRVIKVTRRPDNWIDYIHWAAKKGQAGNLAPKVFSYKLIKGKKTDFSVSIIERMVYTLSRAETDHHLKVVGDLLYSGVSQNNPMAKFLIEGLVPGISDFISDIAKNFSGSKTGHLDLHGGNLMVRQDGSFCVVDPVAGESKSTYKRLRAGDFTPALAFI